MSEIVLWKRFTTKQKETGAISISALLANVNCNKQHAICHFISRSRYDIKAVKRKQLTSNFKAG